MAGGAVRAGRAKPAVLRRGERDFLIGALAEIFALLAEVFLDPEADVKVRLLGILERCPERCPGLAGLPGAIRGMVEHCEAPQDQARHYVHLFFRGCETAAVQPYESVHTHGAVMVPEVVDDLEAIRESQGLGPRSGGGLPPDHLGCELELFARILGELPAAESASARSRKVAAVHSLLSRHLIGFARQFARCLDAAHPHPYYRKATEALVEGLQVCAVVLE